MELATATRHPFVKRVASVCDVCASAAKDKDNFARLTGTHGANSNLFDAGPPAGITKRSRRRRPVQWRPPAILLFQFAN